MDYRQVLNHLSIGVAVIDSSFTVVYWNRWMEEHSLRTQDEMVGRSILAYVTPHIRHSFMKKARAVLERGAPAFFTHKVHQHIFPFHTVRSYLDVDLARMEQTVVLSPLAGPDGDIEQIMVSVFDISDWISYQNQFLESQRELEKLSLIDDLTQIPNRRALVEQFDRQVSIHQRKKRPLAVILIDIDHFKRVNDTHGHQCGDEVLRTLARILMESLRGYDIVGRYGGEEFLVVLPETSRDQAILVAERLRAKVAQTCFPWKKITLQVTVSLGLAVKKEQEKIGCDDLFKVADECLYRAKEHGRNKVVVQDQ